MQVNELGLFICQKTGLEFLVNERILDFYSGDESKKTLSAANSGKFYEVPEDKKTIVDIEYETACGTPLDLVQSEPLILKFRNSDEILISKAD